MARIGLDRTLRMIDGTDLVFVNETTGEEAIFDLSAAWIGDVLVDVGRADGDDVDVQDMDGNVTTIPGRLTAEFVFWVGYLWSAKHTARAAHAAS